MPIPTVPVKVQPVITGPAAVSSVGAPLEGKAVYTAANLSVAHNTADG